MVSNPRPPTRRSGRVEFLTAQELEVLRAEHSARASKALSSAAFARSNSSSGPAMACLARAATWHLTQPACGSFGGCSKQASNPSQKCKALQARQWRIEWRSSSASRALLRLIKIGGGLWCLNLYPSDQQTPYAATCHIRRSTNAHRAKLAEFPTITASPKHKAQRDTRLQRSAALGVDWVALKSAAPADEHPPPPSPSSPT